MSESENIVPDPVVPILADTAASDRNFATQHDPTVVPIIPSHKKFPVLLLFLIPILTIVAVISIYILLQARTLSQEAVVLPTPSPTPTSSADPTEGWQETKISDLGISFKYPAYLTEDKNYYEFTDKSASFFGLDNLILSVKEIKSRQLDPSTWWKLQEIDPIYSEPRKCFESKMTKISNVDALQITSTNMSDPDCLGPHTGKIVYVLTYNQKLIVISSPEDILSTFKFTDQTSTASTAPNTYTCPKSGWVDCMPLLDDTKKQSCSDEAMSWYKNNCPGFQGGAL